jgi:hypothetical protein
MNGSTYIRTIQQNITTHIQKNYYGKIDAMEWESAGDGSLLLLLYIGEEPSVLVFIKKELQRYILKGWERRFQERLDLVTDSKA